VGQGPGRRPAHRPPIQAGTVWLNEVHQYTPHQVFGGHKQSGIGAENSLHGLREYTNWQSITLNKDPDAV
jgi:acyl-CoA reductase-like NAD-dependent aldehyde dehydrogenase